jgi:DNA-binding FrmR family transcriptional regulator
MKKQPVKHDDPSISKINIARRLHCAEGHLHGVMLMVERDEDCVSIVQQLAAVQGALREINRLLARCYLETCFRQRLQDGQMNDAICENRVAEIVSLYHLLGISTPDQKEVVWPLNLKPL